MFHRSFDLSCILDPLERTFVQNAINALNTACSDTVDAWLYASQGFLLNDMNRTLGDYDYIPKTVFASLETDQHNGKSAYITIQILQYIAQDYDGWRIAREQENSRKDNSSNFWNSWKSMKLMPYYNAGSGGGSRLSIGPILEDFLSIKASRNEGYSQELHALEQEIMGFIGQDLEEEVNTLSKIVSLTPSPYCSNLLDTLKKRLAQKTSLQEYNDKLINDAMRQLAAAKESRNPVALKAALNPGWYSTKFNLSDLYKKGSALLSQIS